jgi:uncharacterized protein YbbC (DUF1343 family)
MVYTGLDILEQEGFEKLKNQRVAILSNLASVNQKIKHIIDLALIHKVNLVKLFAPEHGIYGEAQYMQAIENSIDTKTGLKVISLYGCNKQSLYLDPNDLNDIDILVCDLQDVGSRYYTFAYSIAFSLKACAKAYKKCLILDRPNPIGARLTEGNVVKSQYCSFVGEYPLANRHGLTMGELALFFKSHDKIDIDLEISWMKNYSRNMGFIETKLPWVLPSPNMPTLDTALVYPGGCLFEGTNLSEARGTTKPFEFVGAPYINNIQQFIDLINKTDLPGATFRPCYFTPTWDKHKGQLCRGVQIHVTDEQIFEPLKTAVTIIWAARQFEGFAWRTAPYEFVSDRLAIDLLFGDNHPRLMLEQNKTPLEIMDYLHLDKKEFLAIRNQFLYQGYPT